MAPNPLQRGDRFAVGAPQFDLEDAHPGLQAHGTPFRSGQIPVRVDRDGAGLVGFHAPPVARVEPHAGQWKHVVLLRLEQFDHRNIMPVVIRSGDAFWIGNGVLDGFLEDESLFGEFLRAPVSEGGVESLVVEPPHIVVGVGA